MRHSASEGAHWCPSSQPRLALSLSCWSLSSVPATGARGAASECSVGRRGAEARDELRRKPPGWPSRPFHVLHLHRPGPQGCAAKASRLSAVRNRFAIAWALDCPFRVLFVARGHRRSHALEFGMLVSRIDCNYVYSNVCITVCERAMCCPVSVGVDFSGILASLEVAPSA